ncbi:MAG TPA: integrin alpha [Gaiellaceae bacterium]|nr:integrin alpha [Gaiellaceae bacterium]
MSKGKSLSLAVAALVLLSAALAVGASGGGASFVEHDVRVLQEFDSNGPAPAGSYFGWAVSELGDVDGDGVKDAIVGEPYNGGDGATGTTYVYSGRTGRLIHRFDGAPGDQYGFAMADAGDTNGDGVHDVLVGAPGNGPGHVDLYSGRTGALLHRFVGGSDGDAFGWSVSSAGDVDGDHHADVLIGAPQAFGAVGAGYATIYSGRTYGPIRTLTGDAVGDQLGSGAGWSRDVNGDRVPDQIVGARNAGPDQRGRAYVYSGRTGARLYAIDASPHGGQFGSFFVAGVGDVNGDRTPDFYVGDYADTTGGSIDGNPAGRAGVYSGRDGRELHAWIGDSADAGLGPGRSAGDVNGDGRPDLIVGSYTSSAGAFQAGKVQIFSGATGALLRTITSTRENDQLGFDAVGLGDTNRDGVPDELVSAANGNHVYIVAGNRIRSR